MGRSGGSGGGRSGNYNSSRRQSAPASSNRNGSKHHKQVEKENPAFNWSPIGVLALIGAAAWLSHDFDKKKQQKEEKEKARRREKGEHPFDYDNDGYYDDERSSGGYDRYDRHDRDDDRYGSEASYGESRRGRSREQRRYDDYCDDDGYSAYESRRGRSR